MSVGKKFFNECYEVVQRVRAKFVVVYMAIGLAATSGCGAMPLFYFHVGYVPPKNGPVPNSYPQASTAYGQTCPPGSTCPVRYAGQVQCPLGVTCVPQRVDRGY